MRIREAFRYRNVLEWIVETCQGGYWFPNAAFASYADALNFVYDNGGKLLENCGRFQDA